MLRKTGSSARRQALVLVLVASAGAVACTDASPPPRRMFLHIRVKPVGSGEH